MRQFALTVSASVTLDGTGAGTVALGPTFPRERWLPESTSITCTGTIPTTGTPSVFIYAGYGVAPGNVIDSTYNVTGAASSLISGRTLISGEKVFAVWSGGPPNQVATLAVNGQRQVPLWASHSLTR